MTKTKLQKAIRLMKRGWLTALGSALQGGPMALSQRVGQLERRGYVIVRKQVTTQTGSRVFAYRIVSEPQA